MPRLPRRCTVCPSCNGRGECPTFMEEERHIVRGPMLLLTAAAAMLLAYAGVALPQERTPHATLVGAGDIASCNDDRDKATAKLLGNIPGGRNHTSTTSAGGQAQPGLLQLRPRELARHRPQQQLQQGGWMWRPFTAGALVEGGPREAPLSVHPGLLPPPAQRLR